MSLQPRHLLYASALLFAVTIPKHTVVGVTAIAPATQTISNDPKFAKARQVIAPTWLHANVYLAMSALLNVKWARTGGARTLEEQAIVGMQLLAGIWCGWSYYKSALYAGLPMLWGANAATALAVLLQ